MSQTNSNVTKIKSAKKYSYSEVQDMTRGKGKKSKPRRNRPHNQWEDLSNNG